MRYDLSPLYRATVGFDRLASLLDSASKAAGETGREGGEIGRLIARLGSAGFQAGEVEKCIDELQEPQAVAMGDLDLPARADLPPEELPE